MPTYINNTNRLINLPFAKGVLHPYESIETDYFMTAAQLLALDLTLVSDEPYFELSSFVEDHDFVADTYLFEYLIEYKVLRIISAIDIKVYANNALNPSYYPVFGNTQIDIVNSHVIDALYVTTDDTGRVTIIGLSE